MVKAIFFDIDGTLVSFETHRIPESAERAILALREKGILVFIASGRHLLSINNLGSLVFDGYITLNGGYCLAGKEQVIYKHSIPEEDIASLVQYMEKENEFPCIFVHEHTLYLNYHNEQSHQIFRMLDFSEPPVAPLREASKGETFQLVAFFTKEQERAIMEAMPHCEATRWNPLFTDVIPRGSSKSVGIDKMLEHFGIALDETMAFGDGGNDISMLQHAGIGVAMGNAGDEVKKIADYVTSSVDEDGVINALRHFGVL
ncbi:Cof-type HAD-IIB family hydrolase [Butyricimonas sp. Marseille-P3923]|uniref:Cof-type HAD-IIB family hydrolase n=1 Tax=Butyricimonas sp. Marseille-P3923 TaxID=1987504 RepID=UPI000C08733F|nr:Cof-type HAD-IIB family hydrolase [Butyricimonas sp. Marseille-P3923]